MTIYASGGGSLAILNQYLARVSTTSTNASKVTGLVMKELTP